VKRSLRRNPRADGWHERKRRGDPLRRPTYFDRYPIGADLIRDGRKVGWTAALSGNRWWRTATARGPYVGSEKEARAGLEKHLGWSPP